MLILLFVYVGRWYVLVPIVVLLVGLVILFLLMLWARPYGGLRNALSWRYCRPGDKRTGLFGRCFGRKKLAKIVPVSDDGQMVQPLSAPVLVGLQPVAGSQLASPYKGDMQATSTSALAATTAAALHKTGPAIDKPRVQFGEAPQTAAPMYPTPAPPAQPPVLDHAALSPASSMRGECRILR